MNKLECILLIDDDDGSNSFNKMILEDLNVTNHIQIVKDGQEAIDYICNQGEYENNGTNNPQPELIFLDINMPRMGGFEFLEDYHKLSKEQRGEKIIIMLSTSLLETEREKAESYKEVSEFINKHITKEYMEKLIKKYFDHFK